MTVRVTPKGTRGTGFPRLMRGLMRLGAGWMVRRYRSRGTALRINGQPLLLVTTVGARSGARRQVLLSRFPDGEATTSWIVTATAGGSAVHPAWFLNMARNPDNVWVETDGREIRVRPESLEGAERDAAWERIVSRAPSFGSYPRVTDRLIPVVRLSAIE
ncbi:MAG: nitroreductase family deazaflavin-dependent oxidoreductase [Chloroflexi bacterium]|nr:MAG: nitroreductase family deazaflavin-dependent oxidoreductase [Chloroflexota bacterium]